MFTTHRLAASLDLLLAAVPAASREHSPRVCIALSGGLDSTVLLVALAQLVHEGKLNARLRAIHVDHALQADSAQWAGACRELAQAHGVDFDDIRVVVPRVAGQSPEGAAREARYAALADRLEPGAILLTAHHADDQLETILLQWLR